MKLHRYMHYNLKLFTHTLIHLTGRQMLYQIVKRIYIPHYKSYKYNCDNNKFQFNYFLKKPNAYINKTFTFLNIKDHLYNWNQTNNGNLWAYNLNYMDWLIQPNILFHEGSELIDKFINDLSSNNIGLDPYPISLRGINWIKFISIHQSSITHDKLQKWNSSLYSQYRLLEKKLEFHLLGNHLLENAFSLFIASIYFNEIRFFNKSVRLLERELKEQILPDGAHYEQSPMYHCILLDRLLDCYNVSSSNLHFNMQKKFNSYLKIIAQKMLGHLESIVYDDHTIPLLNDSARGIAPSANAIFRYAKHLGINWHTLKMNECGYRKLSNTIIEAIVDVGNIKASYQPGHSHADTFNYEARIYGTPFIIDTGISTYEKNERRQYERSTKSHNTVTLNDIDSSEVWGGFRVGRRAKVKIISEDSHNVIAAHNGYGEQHIHKRSFILEKKTLKIHDYMSNIGRYKNYIHLAPNVKIISINNNYIKTNIADIIINKATKIDIIKNKAAYEYNKYTDINVIVIFFSQDMSYHIVIK